MISEKGYDVITGTPLETLWMFLLNEVEAALVSSVASFALGLEPLPRAPVVISRGVVENVVLMIRKWRRRLKLWTTPQSYTGATVALWYLARRGVKVDLIGDSRNADAWLLIGDEAREATTSFKGIVIDLGKVWCEEVGTPLVYALTVFRRPIDLSFSPYKWRHIEVVPLEGEIYEYLEKQNKILRDYWVRPLIPPRGLLGMLLRSA